MISDLRLRLLGLAEASWGLVLLARPRETWDAAGGGEPEAVDRSAMRILGVRHLAQGAWRACLPQLGRRGLIGLDLLHAASMVPLISRPGPRQGPARLTALLALLTALSATRPCCKGVSCSKS